MKVRVLTAMSGPHVYRAPGDVVDLPEGQARRMVQAGAAELVRVDPPRKRTGRPPRKRVETAAKKIDETR